MLDQISSKISEIEKAIEGIWKNEYPLALFTGIGGLPLFYYMLYKVEGNKIYLEKINEVVGHLYKKLDTDEYGVTYSSGLSGVASILNYLNEKKIIENIDEDLIFMDEIILNFTFNNLTSIDDTDFLHGALGACTYLIERTKYNSVVKEKINDLIHKLCHILNEDIIKGYKVNSTLEYDDSTHRTNCGLAHGRVAEILILCKYFSLYPNNSYVKETIFNCTNSLIAFESDDKSSIYTYPSIAINKYTAYYKIHLGWCYGDQAVSYGLYRAGQTLHNDLFLNKSIEIALKTLQRNSMETAILSNSYDGGFCHGAASVAYLHKKWFEITGNEKFNIAYENFINDLLDIGKNTEGIAGYRKHLGNGNYENAIGLLDGVIGIGIVLIDYMVDDNDWDSFFLLD
ncbi:MAG: hypothetical protein GW849_02355 [Flavobacteriia bacterium]|nr:hypothetical protein [Flavobacteriia bacterium]NCT18030.1 hypothetical protein [Flavobacteriia bacterium]